MNPSAESSAPYMKPPATKLALSPRPKPMSSHVDSGRRSRCVRPSQTHPQARPAAPQRSQRRQGRVPPSRHSPEPAQTGQAGRSGKPAPCHLSKDGPRHPLDLTIREAPSPSQSRLLQQNRRRAVERCPSAPRQFRSFCRKAERYAIVDETLHSQNRSKPQETRSETSLLSEHRDISAGDDGPSDVNLDCGQSVEAVRPSGGARPV